MGISVGGACDKNDETSSNNANQPQVEQEEEYKDYDQTSLKEMMSMGKTLKCEMNLLDEETEGEYKQTMYIDGERFRVDSEITMTGEGMQDMKFHMISDGEWIYTWSTEQESGLKMNIKEMEDMGEKYKENSDLAQGGKVDLEEKFDFSCKKWKKDSSLLIPPKDVEFADFLDQIENFTNTLENMDFSNSEDMCSICDFEQSEEGRQNCLSELGC
ncbi:MAG: hypothetical protein GF349_03040 [Candidatus Magasanikbacteria bacterium]|nr:hypothetical protein [Candidatus Magasanikbacteria bacterium]